MRIKDILSVENISAQIEAVDKTDLIKKLLGMLKNSPKIIDYDKVLESILEREKIISTGVGHGFAFPHSKTNAVSDVIVACATTNNPIDYQSLDGAPVRLAFLLLCREEQVDIHIKLLSRISRLMNEEAFRAKLLTLQSAQEIFDLIVSTEQTLLVH